MIISVKISEKSFGSKSLFTDVDFSVSENEKIGLIGRNGIGKSTILNILTGKDPDYTGDIIPRRGATIVATDQEYSHVGDMTVMEYILSGLPEYVRLTKSFASFASNPNPSMHAIQKYTEDLELFSQKEYHYIEDQVAMELENFQLAGYGTRKFSSLSGGEKRLSEVVKIMHSRADLALIDEPTNFMDYVAKDKFIDWMKTAPESIVVITHDRDVLREVDRIIEIKDGKSYIYKGNYESYLSQNTVRTSTGMNEYEVTQRQIENLKKQVAYARSKKAMWHGTADKNNPFVVMEERCLREIKKLEAVEKPSFWIDKTSAANLNYKDSGRYEKYKARNVRIGLKSADSKSKKVIFRTENLSIGYDKPLFSGKNFELHESGKLEIRGRNGAGKSTLIKALLGDENTNIFDGTIYRDAGIRIGIYEQEVSKKYFDMTLETAIERVYLDKKLSIGTQKVRQLLADYLFTDSDRTTHVAKLSGGQKARFQIISMLANDPQLLILDEPTSHLDLPSIEELENALARYSGAILYISHDGYFRNNLGGEITNI